MLLWKYIFTFIYVHMNSPRSSSSSKKITKGELFHSRFLQIFLFSENFHLFIWVVLAIIHELLREVKSLLLLLFQPPLPPFHFLSSISCTLVSSLIRHSKSKCFQFILFIFFLFSDVLRQLPVSRWQFQSESFRFNDFWN